jgi:uncharacterized lipoprotein YbaY
MNITVRLHGISTDSRRKRCDTIALPPDANVTMLLEELGLADAKGICVVADGKTVRGSHPLHDGAVVSVFPQAVGG